ncbi:MAG: PLDc N-terminal domain-containing protein [Acidobacteriota bacterium]
MTCPESSPLRRALRSAAPFAFATQAFAQSSDADGAAAALGCFACSGVLLLIPVVILILNIALLVWVAKDAKARGIDGSVMWMIVVLLLSLPGLIIYILSRPKGELIECHNCKNRRLQASTKCPHCGSV